MEWIVIIIVGIILICPDKAEEIGKGVGKILHGIKEVKSEKDELMEPINELKNEFDNISK